MQPRWLMRVLVLSWLSASAIFCQTAIPVMRVPNDPLELVTGSTTQAESAEARLMARALLDRAAQNLNAYAAGSIPFHLKISFHSAGNSFYPVFGEFEQTWLTAAFWRLAAKTSGESALRLMWRAVPYDDRPSPLTYKYEMLRRDIFQPMRNVSGPMRTASASWRGSTLTCILTSNSSVETDLGRQWDEREACIDSQSGLLRVYSEAPGAFFIYDYDAGAGFHGKTLPRQVTCYESGSAILEAILTVEDSPALNNSQFTPAKEMISPGTVLAEIDRRSAGFPLPVGSPANEIKRVIVHALLDDGGSVLEATGLQNYDPAITRIALEDVMRSKYPYGASGKGPRVHEALIDVRLSPPVTFSIQSRRRAN